MPHVGDAIRLPPMAAGGCTQVWLPTLPVCCSTVVSYYDMSSYAR